jgi:hypothetical protein
MPQTPQPDPFQFPKERTETKPISLATNVNVPPMSATKNGRS